MKEKQMKTASDYMSTERTFKALTACMGDAEQKKAALDYAHSSMARMIHALTACIGDAEQALAAAREEEKKAFDFSDETFNEYMNAVDGKDEKQAAYYEADALLEMAHDEVNFLRGQVEGYYKALYKIKAEYEAQLQAEYEAQLQAAARLEAGASF